MRAPSPVLILALTSTLALTGCARLASSPLNPLTWFGASLPPIEALTPNVEVPATLVPEGATSAPIELRVPVEQITALRSDRTPDGIIVTATGLAATTGAYNAGLVATGRTGNTLTLEMRAELPPQALAGTQLLTAAIALSNQEVAGIQTIVVRGRQGSLSTRR